MIFDTYATFKLYKILWCYNSNETFFIAELLYGAIEVLGFYEKRADQKFPVNFLTLATVPGEKGLIIALLFTCFDEKNIIQLWGYRSGHLQELSLGESQFRIINNAGCNQSYCTCNYLQQ